MQNQKMHYARSLANSNSAVLLIGERSGRSLDSLYRGISRLGHCAYIDAENEDQFWDELLKATGGELYRPCLETDVAIALMSSALKRKECNLFVPDIDRLFYSEDVRDGRHLGATLRRLWQTQRELTIYASAKSQRSTAFRNTIGRYEYPFWINNWAPVHV